ncbi:MAG: lamin tail domain-containing protein [Candidatus Poribacteria bacterium]|nr:lamin tail domain-containing protein [Candidatus Poribacteria bacterium]
MRLSNKSTFSLICLVLLFAFATVPAMANTMSAEWMADVDAGTDDDQPGWVVTITYTAHPDDSAVTEPTESNLGTGTSGGSVLSGSLESSPATDPTTYKFRITPTTAGDDVDVTAPGFRRVTLMNGDDLASTSIYLPQLVSITAPKSSNGTSVIEATITFAAADADADTPIGPATGLKRTDITDGSANPLSVTMATNEAGTVIDNVYKASFLVSANITIDFAQTGGSDNFPHAEDDDTSDNTAAVLYDVLPPTIGDIAFLSLVANRALDTEDVDEAFDVTVVVTDEIVSGTTSEFDIDVEFTVTPEARGADVTNVGKTPDEKAVARITPKANETTTDWPATPIRIKVTVTDDAGNVATTFTDAVTLAAREGQDPTAVTIPTKALGMPNASRQLTVTFSRDPGTVTVPTGYSISASGAARTITVPANKASGDHNIALSWTGPPAGSDTVTYTVPAGPMVDPNESPEITIPAGGFVVFVREAATATALTDYDSDIDTETWMNMPDLYYIFNTSAIHGGGALILMQSDDSSATGYVALNPGTVGISEIMWAIDEADLGDSNARREGQWIELHNLNTTDATVKLSWRTGAKSIAEDTSINGDLAKPYLDIVTNVYNDRPGNPHWTLPGSNGNTRAGRNFVSAARTGNFNLTSQHQGKHNKRYTKTGDGNSANSPDGRNKGHWAASATAYDEAESVINQVQYITQWHGTPGRVNRFDPERATVRDSRTDINPSGIIINEVANRDDANNQYEWIELRNVSGGDINLNNYQISILTGVGKDEPFIFLPNNNNSVIPAGGVLLLVDSDPFGDPDHPLAVGWKIGKNPEDQVPGLESIGINGTSKEGRYLVVPFGGKNNKFITGLPDDGNFILVVRSADNHEGDHPHGDKGRADLPTDKDSGDRDLNRIVDIAGYVGGLNTGKGYKNAVSETNLWPLKQQGAPDDKNRLSVNKVRRRQHVSTRDGRAGTGNTHNDRKAGQIAFGDIGYSGIGYKRQATNSGIHGGTPGYDNGAQKGRVSDLAMTKLIISEIMLSQGEEGARTKLPQWIEIYNPSPHPVGLGGWRLIIENPRDPIRTINLGGGSVKTILSEQTILIVSGSARDIGSDTLPSSTLFPPTRVYNVYKHQKNEFNMTSRFDPILNQEAFHITLIDGAALDLNNAAQKAIADDPTKSLRVGGSYYTISDTVGNLDGNPRTNDTPEDNGKMKFEMGLTEDGERTSLIRIFDGGPGIQGVARDGTGMVKPLGGTEGVGVARMKGIDSKYSWVHAADTSDRYVRHTWYGDESDWGTPADRGGQILPVELSFFRPTLEDGKVTIRWTTESELDNAGFNILRSETRKGQYKQVNTELIQGAGTTGERTTYNWVDPTAKPGVVYYYQIEDVSFAGEHQVLATTKLKGLISADGKLTTTWSELKQASQ